MWTVNCSNVQIDFGASLEVRYLLFCIDASAKCALLVSKAAGPSSLTYCLPP